MKCAERRTVQCDSQRERSCERNPRPVAAFRDSSPGEQRRRESNSSACRCPVKHLRRTELGRCERAQGGRFVFARGSEIEVSQTTPLDGSRRSADVLEHPPRSWVRDGLPNQARSNGLQNLSSLSPLPNRNEGERAPLTEKGMGRSERLPAERGLPMDKNVPASAWSADQVLCRYPSLYDMYCASFRPGEYAGAFWAEDFATTVWNRMPSPWICRSVLNMCWPGDGLAINFWGGVSQRMFRCGSRRGITLPEAGRAGERPLAWRCATDRSASAHTVPVHCSHGMFRKIGGDRRVTWLAMSLSLGAYRHQFAFDSAERAVRGGWGTPRSLRP